MRWGIRTSLVVGLAGLLLAAGVIAAIVIGQVVGGEAEARVLASQRLRAAADAVALEAGCTAAPRCADGLKATVARLGAEGVVRRAVLGPSGRLLAGAGGPDPLALDVVQGAGPTWMRDVRPDTHARGAGTDHRVVVPLRLADGRRAALVTVFPLDALHDGIAERQRLVMLYLLFDLFAVLLFGIYVSGRVLVRPVRALTAAAERVGADSEAELPPPSGPAELRRLSEAFAAMLGRLDGARDDLVRSEKLATVGRLAAGVAHEVGNPLASVMGYVEYLRDPRGCPPELQAELLERMDRELGRMRGTLRQLLDFSRPTEGITRAVDAREAVNSAIELVRYQKALADVQLELLGPGARVMADADHLRQVLLNLLLNAAEAMADSDPRRIAITVDAAGGKGRIVVTDTGPGVDPAIADALFEPFATTRPAGQGTGLGLPISRRLVEQMGGVLALRQGEGGATFVIELPLAGPESA